MYFPSSKLGDKEQVTLFSDWSAFLTTTPFVWLGPAPDVVVKASASGNLPSLSVLLLILFDSDDQIAATAELNLATLGHLRLHRHMTNRAWLWGCGGSHVIGHPS